MDARPPREPGDRQRRSGLPVLSALVRALLAPLTLDSGRVDDTPGTGASVSRRRAQVVDGAVAVGLYIMGAVMLVPTNDVAGEPYAPQALHLLALAGAFPVLLRRRLPLLAWQVTLVAAVVGTGLVAPTIAAAQLPPDQDLVLPVLDAAGPVIGHLLCLYAVAARTSTVHAIGTWLWSLGGLVAVATLGARVDPVLIRHDPALWLSGVAAVTLVPLFGHNQRTGRRTRAALEAQRRRNEQEQAARARLEERSRIARDLHDVVAHNMSVIAIQAEAAPLRAPDDAEALRDELAQIRATALETLTEMRRILGVLRNPEDRADTAPAPGVDQIGALVDKVAATGADVRLHVTGAPRPVPPGVGVSAYRIVQESLSNALRHAPGADVTVSLAYGDDGDLRVRVVNGPPSGPVPPDDRPGAAHGLVGMRERAATLGGSFRAVPTSGGGFAVEAVLPLQPR